MNGSMMRGVVVVLVLLGSWAWGAWDHTRASQSVRDRALVKLSEIDGFQENADYFEELLAAEHPAAFKRVRELQTIEPEVREIAYFYALTFGMERRASEDGREQVARQLARLKAELMAG